MELVELGLILVAFLSWRMFAPSLRRELLPVGVLLMLALVVEVVANFISGMNGGEDNLWVYSLYLPFDAGVTMWICSVALRWNSGSVGLLFGGAYAVMILAELRLRHNFLGFPNTTFMLASLVLCVFLLLALFRLATRLDLPLPRQWLFWALLGQLVYFGAMIPYNGLVDRLYVLNRSLAQQLSLIDPLLAIMRYALTSVALVVAFVNGRTLHEHAL